MNKHTTSTQTDQAIHAESSPVPRPNGWTAVQHAATALPGMSDPGFRCWVALDRWAWRDESPSNAELAAACGWFGTDGKPAAWKARRYLVELEELGIVQRVVDRSSGYADRAAIRVVRPQDWQGGGTTPAPHPPLRQRSGGTAPALSTPCANVGGGTAPAFSPPIKTFLKKEENQSNPIPEEGMGGVAAHSTEEGKNAALEQEAPSAPACIPAPPAPAPPAPRATVSTPAPMTTAALLAALPGSTDPAAAGRAAHRLVSELGDTRGLRTYRELCAAVVAGAPLARLEAAVALARAKRAEGAHSPSYFARQFWDSWAPRPAPAAVHSELPESERWERARSTLRAVVAAGRWPFIYSASKGVDTLPMTIDSPPLSDELRQRIREDESFCQALIRLKDQQDPMPEDREQEMLAWHAAERARQPSLREMMRMAIDQTPRANSDTSSVPTPPIVRADPERLARIRAERAAAARANGMSVR